MRCNCPYIVCKYHGNCEACIAHNRRTGDMAHCMEARAMELGARFPLRLPSKVYLAEDEDELSRRSAMLIAQTVRQKPDALFSLAAGSTAIGTYRQLKSMADRGEVDFSRTHFAALDEWLDLEDESENCNAFMMKHFYGPLGIRKEQITRFDIHARDLSEACRRMDEVLFAHGGIDFMLLGMGMNGHLGLNEPGGDFNRYACVTELDPITMQVGQKYFTGTARLTRGITLGIRHLFECKCVVLQVSGAHKADIVEKLIRTPPTEALPATVIKLLPGGVLVLDRDAAARVLDVLENSGRLSR